MLVIRARHDEFIKGQDVLHRAIAQQNCVEDPEGLHDVVLLDTFYYCQACGWPAVLNTYNNMWFVLTPFIVQESP